MSTPSDGEKRRGGPSEADSPDVRFSVRDFVAAIRYEAHRREGSQQALVNSGMRTAEDPAERRRIDCLDAAALFLERLEPFIPDFRAFLRGRRFSQGRR